MGLAANFIVALSLARLALLSGRFFARTRAQIQNGQENWRTWKKLGNWQLIISGKSIILKN
jgi:hypothetical protein